MGAGIGLTLRFLRSDDLIASFSVPTKTKDAQRTEVLGPTLAALVSSTMAGGQFWIEGDSQYVIGLLDKRYLPNDMFLYNCVELVRDLMGSR